MAQELHDHPLSVRQLKISYNVHSEPVLHDFDYDLPAGSMVAVMGPNGAGKSSFIKAILGLVPSQGDVYFFGNALAQNRGRVSYMAQRQDVDWNFPINVLDVVLMGLSSCLGLFGCKKRQMEKELAMEALAKVGMADMAHRPIGDLSGGQQQRVFFARALIKDPELLILDEPLAGIDLKAQEVILRLLLEEKANGKTILCVHHDLHSAPYYFDKGLLINRTLIASGNVKDVLSEENIEHAYGIITLPERANG